MADNYKNNSFFNELAISCGTHSIPEAIKIYQAFVKAIARSLKAHRTATLPDFGTFIIKPYAGRNVHHATRNEMYYLPSMNVLWFKADNKLKKYIRNL